MNVKEAMCNPARFFNRPDQVCESGELSHTDKIKILQCWEYDARELLVAEEENMGGGPESMLDEVIRALHRLGGDTAAQRPNPDKHGS